MVKWMEVKVTTSQEAKEAVADLLYKAGADGLVIEDSVPVALADDVEDYAPVADESFLLEEVRVIAYLPIDVRLAAKLEQIRQDVLALGEFGLDPGRADVTLAEVEEEDWASAWKAFFKPLPIGKNLLIKPTWEDIGEATDRVVVELDPGMAFGTGTHCTTTMCLELLEESLQGGERVIDVGCGSGILAIAAAKLGAAEVLGLDYDPVAVRVAEENVVQNKVEAIVSVAPSNLLQAADGQADVIVANIIARIILELIPQTVEKLKSGGLFVASGIIQERFNSVRDALAEYGFEIITTRQEGDWIALLAKRR